MKKVLLMTAALFAFGFSNAQDAKSNDKQVQFGVKAGLNVSMLSGGDLGVNLTSDTKSKVGFHIGGLAEIKFNDKFSIQPELLYSQEGGNNTYSTDYSGTFYTFDQDITLSKINLPIIFKYYVIEGLSIEAGPQLDYIMKAKSDATVIVPGSGQITYNTDMSDNTGTIMVANYGGSSDSAAFSHDYGLKKLNFGFDLGAGYQLPSMGLFFQARYTLGLTDFTDNDYFMAGTVQGSSTPVDVRQTGSSFKNSNLQISVGYKF
jgi:hypothetical protein